MSQKAKPSPKPSPKNTLFNYFSKNTGNTPQSVPKSIEKPVASKNENVPKLSAKKLEFGELRREFTSFFALLNALINRKTTNHSGFERRRRDH
jgi:hypothetical protein